MSDSTSEAELDDVLDCLSNETRRRIVESLRANGSGGGVDQRALAASVAGGSAVEVHHVHLPRLDDSGVIEWARDDGVVDRGPLFGEAIALLEAVERLETVRS